MQNKLRLNLDQLDVDSFEPQTDLEGIRGTVNAKASLLCGTLYDATCRGYGTCGIYPCKQIP